MVNNDLKKSVLINLRCVTQSCKGGVALNQLQNDYKALIGTSIPFKEMGYDSLESFACDIPDVLSIKKGNNGQLIAEAVADASTAHIASLISKQKSSKNSKKNSKPSVVTRKWGKSAKSENQKYSQWSSNISKAAAINTSKAPTQAKIKNQGFSPGTKISSGSSYQSGVGIDSDLKKSVLIDLKCVVQSCKGGVPLNRLHNDYKRLVGAAIPFKELGYSSVESVVSDIPEIFSIKKNEHGQFIVEIVVDTSTFQNSSLPSKLKNSENGKVESTIPSINSSRSESNYSISSPDENPKSSSLSAYRTIANPACAPNIPPEIRIPKNPLDATNVPPKDKPQVEISSSIEIPPPKNNLIDTPNIVTGEHPEVRISSSSEIPPPKSKKKTKLKKKKMKTSNPIDTPNIVTQEHPEGNISSSIEIPPPKKKKKSKLVKKKTNASEKIISTSKNTVPIVHDSEKEDEVEKLRKSVLLDIESIIKYKGWNNAILLRDLEKHYEELLGVGAFRSFQRLGFNSLASFINESPDTLTLHRNIRAEIIVKAVFSKKPKAEITDHLSKQESSRENVPPLSNDNKDSPITPATKCRKKTRHRNLKQKPLTTSGNNAVPSYAASSRLPAIGLDNGMNPVAKWLKSQHWESASAVQNPNAATPNSVNPEMHHIPDGVQDSLQNMHQLEPGRKVLVKENVKKVILKALGIDIPASESTGLKSNVSVLELDKTVSLPSFFGGRRPTEKDSVPSIATTSDRGSCSSSVVSELSLHRSEIYQQNSQSVRETKNLNGRVSQIPSEEEKSFSSGWRRKEKSLQSVRSFPLGCDEQIKGSIQNADLASLLYIHFTLFGNSLMIILQYDKRMSQNPPCSIRGI